MALDSCNLIDMAEFLAGTADLKSKPGYFRRFRNILQQNALNPDGTRNPNGRYVLTVLPRVWEEITHRDGKLTTPLQKLFQQNFFWRPILNEEYKSSFNDLEDQLAKKYSNIGLFLDYSPLQYKRNQKSAKNRALLEHEHAFTEQETVKPIPSSDSHIVAQATILNITLSSRDKHVLFREQSPHKFPQFIQANRKVCQRRGFVAEPMRLETILNLESKDWIPPYIDNTHFLSKDDQIFISNVLGIKISKPKELSHS